MPSSRTSRAAPRSTTELTYSGKLWGCGALQRVLDDEIRRGKGALRDVVIDGPTR